MSVSSKHDQIFYNRKVIYRLRLPPRPIYQWRCFLITVISDRAAVLNLRRHASRRSKATSPPSRDDQQNGVSNIMNQETVFRFSDSFLLGKAKHESGAGAKQGHAPPRPTVGDVASLTGTHTGVQINGKCHSSQHGVKCTWEIARPVLTPHGGRSDGVGRRWTRSTLSAGSDGNTMSFG